MANEKLRRAENAPGAFFVDSTCIDCDTCRWVAPASFDQKGGMSRVYAQPGTPRERLAALQALHACPTASIGWAGGDKKELFDAMSSFPIPVTEEVFYCGFASKASFGAASYLIVREGGNVMVDCPRLHGGLAKLIQAKGGIRWMVLTHRDDVADHHEWTDRFGCARVMHQDDIGRETEDVEVKLSGGEAHALAPGLTVVPVPGHTKGHVVLHYADKYLFTGDHLEEDGGMLRAFRDYCWYDWKEQTRSMRKLLDYPFEWVLPGHGRRGHGSKAEMRAKLEECIQWMETQ